MISKIMNFLRWIVGDERGYFDEGNVQWYYVISMVIANLLLWKIDFNIALPFMLLSVIHFVTIYLYGSIQLEKYSKAWSFAFWVIHFFIAIIALCINATAAFWSFVCIILMISMGGVQEDYSSPKNCRIYALFINTLIFLSFIVSVLILPIAWWYKILMVILEQLLHLAVDYLQIYIPTITEVTNTAWKRFKK